MANAAQEEQLLDIRVAECVQRVQVLSQSGEKDPRNDFRSQLPCGLGIGRQHPRVD